MGLGITEFDDFDDFDEGSGVLKGHSKGLES
jgi:hypothetical protein